MEPTRKSDAVIDAEACDWVIRLLDSETDLADPIPEPAARYAACRNWLLQSARHVRAFLQAADTLHALDGIDPHHHLDVARLFAEGSGNIVLLRPVARPLLRQDQGLGMKSLESPKHLPWAVTVVMAFLLVLPLWLQHLNAAPLYYSAGIGERRFIELEDGSEVRLNTRSRIAIQITPHGREVQLLEGEALFDVVHDSQRPFRVVIDDAVINDVGTKFDVYRQPTKTTVSVMEGTVEVSTGSAPHFYAAQPSAEQSLSPALFSTEGKGGSENRMRKNGGDTVTREFLQAGQRGLITHHHHVVTVAITDVSEHEFARQFTWQEGILTFEGETLAQAVAELNRYNRRQLVVDEGAAGNVRLGGTFRMNDPDAFAAALEHAFGLRILPSDFDANTIRLAGPTSKL
jgi:transmembrane sensor